MNDSDGKLTETKLVLLLAEDDLSEVLLIRRALERLPMIGQISVVSSGDAAIAYVQGHDQWADRTSYPFPDVLLLDYRMPGLSGLDALCWVRSEPGFERLPVAVLSTDFTDRESQMIDRLNAVRCLKRAGTQEMAEVIQRGLIAAMQKVRPATGPCPQPAVEIRPQPNAEPTKPDVSGSRIAERIPSLSTAVRPLYETGFCVKASARNGSG